MGTTTLHILTLMALSLNYFEILILQFSTRQRLMYDRAYTLQFFILGVQDIFVCFMLWFMMDNSNRPLYYENHKTGDLYQMLDVVKNNTD